MKLTLIGPRSIGKTTIGKVLAKKLKIPYFDFDKYVEKEIHGIDNHIKNYGVDSYRIKEQKILKKFIKSLPKKFVISVGGGTIASQMKTISRNNSKILKKISKIIYLSPSDSRNKAVNMLYKREKKRKGRKTYIEVKNLFILRKPVYEKVYDIKVEINKKSIKSIVNEIIKKLKC